MALRIAYLDPFPLPGTLPPQIQVLHTVDALARGGNEVTVITPKPEMTVEAVQILGRPLADGAKLVYLPNLRKRWWFPFASRRPFYAMAAWELKRHAVDVVLCRNLKMAERVIKQGLNTPLFFETHELFARSFQESHDMSGAAAQRKRDRIAMREQFVYSNVAGLFALTQPLAEEIAEGYGIQRPMLELPDGVDLEQVESAENWGGPIQEPLLLYLGSLHRWKGVETLVDAMAHVPTGTLGIAGGTPERIGQLQQRARERQLENRVHFFGAVAPQRRFGLLRRATVCLLPLTHTSIGSRYTSPLKLFEYMAVGKAMVVADVPSLRRVVKPDQHALMVPPEDPKALADAVNRLLFDPDLRHALGDAARRRVEGFTWDRRAQRMTEFMQRVLNAPGEGTINGLSEPD